MGSKTEIKWLETPEEHDYPAAESYLSLIYDSKTATRLSQQLKQGIGCIQIQGQGHL